MDIEQRIERTELWEQLTARWRELLQGYETKQDADYMNSLREEIKRLREAIYDLKS